MKIGPRINVPMDTQCRVDLLSDYAKLSSLCDEVTQAGLFRGAGLATKRDVKFSDKPPMISQHLLVVASCRGHVLGL